MAKGDTEGVTWFWVLRAKRKVDLSISGKYYVVAYIGYCVVVFK